MSTTALAGAINVDVKGLVQLNGFYALFDEDTAQLPNASPSNDYHTNAYLQLARLGCVGKITEDWSFVVTPLDYRYARDSSSVLVATLAEEASLSYTGLKPFRFKIGIFRPEYGFENATSDANLAFPGRSAVAQLLSSQPGLGLEVSGLMEGFTYAVSAHVPTTDSVRVSNRILGKTDWLTVPTPSFNARVTHRTQWSEQGVLAHVGASLASVGSVLKLGWDINGSQPDIFIPIPIWSLRTSMPPVTFIASASQPGAYFPLWLPFSKRFTVVGAEAAGQKGPLSAHAEYHYAKPEVGTASGSASAPTLKVRGFSLEAGYVITGETRTYCEHARVFTNVVPHSEAGAWEIVARLDQIKLEALNSKVQKTAYAAGVNYYVNSYAAVKLNYALDCIIGERIKDTKLHALSLGTQFSF